MEEESSDNSSKKSMTRRSRDDDDKQMMAMTMETEKTETRGEELRNKDEEGKNVENSSSLSGLLKGNVVKERRVSSSSSISQNFTKVTFRVKAKVRYGETVYVVGDIPSLGSWGLEYGEPLVTTPESYPVWYNSNPIAVLKGQTVRYKYAIFCGGVFDRWEDRTEIRTLKAEGSNLIQFDELQVGEGTGEQADLEAEETIDAKADKTKDLFLSTNDAVYTVDRMLSSKSLRKADAQEESELQQGDGVIFVTYILPVTIDRDESSGKWIVEWDEDALFSRKKSSAADRMRVVFIGYPKTKFPVPVSEHESLMAALARFRCVPVFLDDKLRDLHYNGYVIGTLHNIIHNVIDVYGPLPTRWWNRTAQEQAWQAYSTVNRMFAEKVVEVYSESDIIWIHGEELLLLPSFLARRLSSRQTSIGLFLHSPFPSSEIFRTLSVRDDLLRGMLNADHIGFHIYEYARHFLTCCRRLLRLPYNDERRGCLQIEYQGRKVTISVCHAGIEPEFVRARLHGERVLEKVEKWTKSITTAPPVGEEDHVSKDRTVIVGLDHLDRLRGVYLKLLAFEQMLRENPEWQKRACIVQVLLLPDRKRVHDENEMRRRDIKKLCARINKTFSPRNGSTASSPSLLKDSASFASSSSSSSLSSSASSTSPSKTHGKVVYLVEKESFGLDDRLALWAMGDIMMVTPMKEGFSPHPFEFVVVKDECKNIAGLRSKANVILSEFSAASRVLQGTLRVNPWRLDEVVGTLVHALTMSDEERNIRRATDLAYANHHIFTGWAKRMLTDIKRSRQNVDVEQTNTDDLTFSGFGLGLGFRAVGFRPNFSPVDDELLIRAYRSSSQRLILLDYGGTTVSDDSPKTESFKFGAKRQPLIPSKDVVAALQVLCMDPRNTVFIVSGREREELEMAFTDIRGLGLTAEHGYYYSWPEKRKHGIGKRPSRSTDTSRSNSLSSNKVDEEPASAMEKFRSPTPTPLEEMPSSLSITGLSSSGSSSSSNLKHVSLNANLLKERPRTEPTPPSGSSTQEGGPKAREWERLEEHFDDSWMELSHKIIDVYTQRTSGTYIELKGSTIQWQYRDADPEFGELQATELQDHLESVLKAFPVEIVAGKSYVEVRPEGCGKAKACEHIINKYWSSSAGPDFIICIGDDVADETMFEFLQGYTEMLREIRSQQSPRPEVQFEQNLFNIVVGKKPSFAQYYLDDVKDVRNLLTVLAKVSNRIHVSRSLTDVRLLTASSSANSVREDDNQTNGNGSGSGTSANEPMSSRPLTADSIIASAPGQATQQPLQPNKTMSLPALTDYFVENRKTTLEEYLQHISEDGEGIYF